MSDLANNRSEDVWRSQVVYGLSEADEDGSDAELVIGEVLRDVRVKGKDAEFVCTHDTGEELHEEDFVIQ